MKRVPLFLLAVLLLLSACGQIAPEPASETTAEITAEIETTTETETTIEEESAEITWRIVDVNSEEGRETQKWLEDQYNQLIDGVQEPRTEFPMGKDKTIRTSSGKITLRDSKTGKDTTLLEKEYMGEETDPEKALLDEVPWRYPRLIETLDERYFVYCWGYWEGNGQPAVYDTKNMRTVSIAYGKGDWYTGKKLIFADALYLTEGTYGPWEGPLRLMRVDLKALDKLKDGESLSAVDVMAEIPGEKDVNNRNYSIVTQDQRYFIMNDFDGLRVYDLRQKKLALDWPVTNFGPGAEEEFSGSSFLLLHGNKMYWTERAYQTDLAGYGKYLAEITLP
ncbi:MAG: hypothetical protein FWC27_12235 [Firmicutes bacterium]|nr:hypothetical protein [Bacillota bacterium]